jgi:hypothetical protein
MISRRRKLLLVGDNPFHGISHLSQERARGRGDEINKPEYAASLVATSLENGANGFMFSVSENTLEILKKISKKRANPCPALYAIVPYAYEYVRLATHLGTVGLAKKLAKQVALSRNLQAIMVGLRGVISMDPVTIMKTYLLYEISRINSSIGKQKNLDSVLLHEVITDMALALDLDWLFRSYVDFVKKLGIQPGFETRNFAYLVNRFKKWNFDFGEISIATPFNKIGFQMNPSKKKCERALREIPESNVIGMSILAAGYLRPSEAIEYIEGLSNLKAIVVGVSKERHAHETFKFIGERV